jgi:nitrate reductase gamma subunit
MHEGFGGVVPYLIIAIAAFQLWYSWSQDKSGVLR